MSFLGDLTSGIAGKWYEPAEYLSEDEKITSANHYVRVIGANAKFSKKNKAFAWVNLWYKLSEPINEWTVVVRQEVSLDILSHYHSINEEDLPWNNGERIYESNLTKEDIDAFLRRVA